MPRLLTSKNPEVGGLGVICDAAGANEHSCPWGGMVTGWGSHRGVWRFLRASFFRSSSRWGEQKHGYAAPLFSRASAAWV